MYSRSNSMALSIQTNQPEHFAVTRMMATRSREPEIFTFERIPAQATAARSYAPIRPRKRCTGRVMYPPKVRMHLPPVEKSLVKRWLIILCLVVALQIIYTEEPCFDTPVGSGDSPASDYQVLPFQSAEEHARHLTDAAGASEGLPLPSPTCDHLSSLRSSSWDQILLNTTCPSPGLEMEMSRMYQQSTRNGYVVALLVYHKLGSDSN